MEWQVRKLCQFVYWSPSQIKMRNSPKPKGIEIKAAIDNGNFVNVTRQPKTTTMEISAKKITTPDIAKSLSF